MKHLKHFQDQVEEKSMESLNVEDKIMKSSHKKTRIFSLSLWLLQQPKFNLF